MPGHTVIEKPIWAYRLTGVLLTKRHLVIILLMSETYQRNDWYHLPKLPQVATSKNGSSMKKYVHWFLVESWIRIYLFWRKLACNHVTVFCLVSWAFGLMALFCRVSWTYCLKEPFCFDLHCFPTLQLAHTCLCKKIMFNCRYFCNGAFRLGIFLSTQ